MRNSSKNILLILLLILIGVSCALAYYYYDKSKSIMVENLNYKKENKQILSRTEKHINELIEISDELQKKNDSLLGKKNDEKSIDGITIGNKPISLEQLISIANKLSQENSALKNSRSKDSVKIKNYSDLIKQLESNKLIYKNPNNNNSSISYVNIEYYRDYIKRCDSLRKSKTVENVNLQNELNAKNTLLDLIKKNYGIDTEVEYGKEKNQVKLLNTQKIDSALWIYPYYKHKIKTNKKGETIIK